MCLWGRLRRFHGIFPSKNKQDKRFKKVAEEREKMKRALGAGDGDDNSVARMHAVQEQTATPYLVRHKYQHVNGVCCRQ